jgi:hypothetical protein
MMLRSPALHFLCLGAALFVAIRLGAAPPRPAGASDDEMLYRAAIDLGVDRDDRAVRGRLARLATFVGEDATGEAALVEEARRLGLARNDLVVRRHLALVMRLAAGRLDAADLPTETDERAYLAAHETELATPARVRFTHVYLGRARHGDAVDARADALLAELRRDAVPSERGPAYGDPFPIGSTVGPLSDAAADRQFGPGFAAALASATPGTWSGPIRSSYGLHVVWVHERLPATMPSLEAVHGRVVHRLLRERQDARTRARIAALRAG